MAFNTIGIVGAGIMGHGIAWLGALSGFKVIMCDINDKALKQAMTNIEKLATKAVQKNPELNVDGIINRILPTTELETCKEAEFVIEAIWEDAEKKKQLLQSVEQVCSSECFLATNTSALPITELSSALIHKTRFVGMHFFNPPYVMPLIEVIRGYYTSEDTLAAAMELARSMGRRPILVKKDSPGFIVNRILTAQFIEAIRLVDEGIASPSDIDTAVIYGLNHPMGVFALQDMIGLDTINNVIQLFERELDPVKWKVPIGLKQLVRAGRLGKKSGAGWFDYPSDR